MNERIIARQQEKNIIDTGGLLQRKCACGRHMVAGVKCKECQNNRTQLQRHKANDTEVATEPLDMHEMLRSPNESLDSTTNNSMKYSFNCDFSQVPLQFRHLETAERSDYKQFSSFAVPVEVSRQLPVDLQLAVDRAWLHNDQFAHLTARVLDLEAFTVGEDIYFAKGRWKPKTNSGIALLQHELEHIAQGEGQQGTIEGWSTSGHRTITLKTLAEDARFSERAKRLLANTAPVPDFNRPQIIQDMLSFWAGKNLIRAPIGAVGGFILGSITTPEQGTQTGGIRVSGALPQAVLGTGLIPTIPAEERMRGGEKRPELSRTRVTQELANHGEDSRSRNRARMNEYVDQGVRQANACELYNGLVQLGYALHVAQDRGSHGEGYTAKYVQGRPHHEIDNMSTNPKGLQVAIENSRTAINRFHAGLSERKRLALRAPLSLENIRPPVLETLLARPETTFGPRVPATPEAGITPSGGINIITIEF